MFNVARSIGPALAGVLIASLGTASCWRSSGPCGCARPRALPPAGAPHPGAPSARASSSGDPSASFCPESGTNRNRLPSESLLSNMSPWVAPTSSPALSTVRLPRRSVLESGGARRGTTLAGARPASQDGRGSRLRGTLGGRPREGRFWQAEGGGFQSKPAPAWVGGVWA
jgi:hypothetical protein